jgi:3-methyl-2-oxobutanoate hydroxymethyltransferase
MKENFIKSIHDFRKMKEAGQMISMVTCYDYSFARIMADSDVDAILVGDSCGNVMAGYENTIPVTVDEIIYHARSVFRGAPKRFIVADMPFMSYQVSREEALRNAGRILKESGAQSVKLEGGEYFCDTVHALTRASIPVMGHLGLTPQSVHSMGGYRVQGKSADDAERMKKDALLLQEAGCFSIVLEMVPESLAAEISQSLSIPTIGIGAGRKCDGQVLVLQDLLGMDKNYERKYLKKFADLATVVTDAFNRYDKEVKGCTFPSESNIFK